MIDLHSHILPGFDDGPQELDESIAMATMAVAAGTSHLAATPHNTNWRAGNLQQEIHRRVATLQAELDARQVPLKLLVGVEVYLLPELRQQIAAKQAYPLDNTRYMLVELPFTTWPNYTEQMLFELQIMGYTPIIAHPERYTAVYENLERVVPLVERGMLLQLTSTSITGEMGSRAVEAARQLLDHNLAHLVASDAHNSTKRPPVLSQARLILEDWVGAERALQLVQTVPQAIIDNRPVELPAPLEVKRKRRWFW
ncbi:MAG: tyrosine protein phosphatase [Chloroflexi bacterium]|nr:tyrosine protein phosphatase [Chloroflexota bacterium]